jgi:hypothetical protein
MRASLALVVLLSACLDKAKADYDKCIDRDRNYDVAGAVAACQAAVAADPKSTSGEAAAKKLLDLQTVSDKMKVEREEKSQRETSIKKDDPPLVIVHPTASAAPSSSAAPTVLSQAQALMAKGDDKGARALIQERALAGDASPEELKLLKSICKAQKDKACLAALAKAGK